MNKLYELFERLSQAENEENLWQEIFAAFASLGYDKTVFIQGGKGLPPFSKANLSHEFANYYKREQLIRVDPFVQICLTKPHPMRTGLHFLENYPHISKAQLGFAFDVAEAGFKSGFSIPLPLSDPQQFEGWNIGGDLSRKASIAVLDEHEKDLQLLAHYAYHCIQRQRTPKITLTAREYDCLNYLAMGMRTRQIGEKLQLSDSGIEYHLKNIRQKLGVNTREHAVAIAVKFNLINPF